MTELRRKPAPEADPGGPPGRQIRVLLGGGILGAVLLAASLVVNFSGANDVSVPQLPKLPPLPTSFPTGLPSGFPTGLPTSFPTGLPSGFPTRFPGLPTTFPSLPGFPGGGS
ncbi:hypothetical protein OG689_39105 [Kitasatospora sp. NBC_00240]|uniref:hypothetical protein n=1 Tax=Kitasatospora sp. NBC_00240 TaxID=2903567 RepID=UPI0022520FBF|nr:hypothetical protein [Kitasatospora sp. NBC_00240]MCX5215204.1 hypothetical protein [Kitasatospora sp. NBC_00240]